VKSVQQTYQRGFRERVDRDSCPALREVLYPTAVFRFKTRATTWCAIHSQCLAACWRKAIFEKPRIPLESVRFAIRYPTL